MKYTNITLKKYLILFCIGFAFLTSCGEKKNAETTAEKAETEMKAKAEQAEVDKKEAMEKAEAMKKTAAVEKEKMKADSIRQVKEHGHAH